MTLRWLDRSVEMQASRMYSRRGRTDSRLELPRDRNESYNAEEKASPGSPAKDMGSRPVVRTGRQAGRKRGVYDERSGPTRTGGVSRTTETRGNDAAGPTTT